MKRQNVRKAILIISLLLFPITLYYFSPYLVIQGAIESIVSGSLIIFVLMLLTSIFMGRAFCGWLCPAGGLQECMMLANNKNAKGGMLELIKYVIWILWIGIIVMIVISVGGFRRVDFWYQTTNGISVANPMAYIVYYAVLFLVVILSLTAGKRGFCHYVCWMAPFMVIGTKLNQFLRLPSLRLLSDKNECISCRQCSKKCPMSLDVEKMVKIESMENTECILCGECIDVCPKSVIKYAVKINKSSMFK